EGLRGRRARQPQRLLEDGIGPLGDQPPGGFVRGSRILQTGEARRSVPGFDPPGSEPQPANPAQFWELQIQSVSVGDEFGLDGLRSFAGLVDDLDSPLNRHLSQAVYLVHHWLHSSAATSALDPTIDPTSR